MSDLPTHTKCPHCNHLMRMCLWCYAHTYIPWEVACEKCGKMYRTSFRRAIYVKPETEQEG